MDGTSDSPSQRDAVEFEPFPTGLSAGLTVLVAGPVDPTSYAVSLRALSQFGDGDDSALVVTTTTSADRTVDRYDAVCSDSDSPVLRLVDATSENQSLSSPYGDQPVVFTPSPGDLERLVVSLSELTGNRPPASETRHLVVRSLTPLLENASTDDVCTILERISGLRTGSGLSLFGLDYTAHDEGTMATLSDHIDSILWVTERSGVLEFKFSPTGGIYNRSFGRRGTDD